METDLDFSGETITLIADDTTGFDGVFDGQNYTISNFSHSEAGTDYIGLFRRTGVNSTVKNLKVLSASVTGRTYTGILIGHSGGIIDNCHTSGSVTSSASRVGGLAGRFWSTQAQIVVKNSSSSATVSATEMIGGLVGWVRGSIEDSFATGNVSGDRRIGGLIGVGDQGSISGSYATGNVTATGTVGLVGGLAGGVSGSITKSYSTGTVSAANADYAGGLSGTLGGGSFRKNI